NGVVISGQVRDVGLIKKIDLMSCGSQGFGDGACRQEGRAVNAADEKADVGHGCILRAPSGRQAARSALVFGGPAKSREDNRFGLWRHPWASSKDRVNRQN